ncbi:MAG: TonB-dependent receptor [Caulobacter sp.]|nr:TonB-dependent receptor [Caulobacter sp.]
MKTMWKSILLAGAAWTAVSGVAVAQESNGDTEVGAIVVTARRTEETLQSVPGAVSAFSERTLDRLQATDLTGLQGAIPNVTLSQGRGSSNATNIFIRGIGQPDALQTFDPAVGVYVDDVYYSRIRGTQFDLLDLERVEVLRGPQGTLYGKNTIGGALKVVSRKPGQDFRANAALSIGDYNQVEAKGAISGPISETLALGLAALSAQRDGYVTDPVTGAQYNDKNTWAVRGALAFTPNSIFRVDVSADYSRDDAAMTVGQATSTLTDIFGTPLIVVANPPPAFNFKTRTTTGLPNSTKLTHYGFAGTVTANITDNFTLKSITAYRNLTTDDYIDIDASQLSLGDVFVGVDQNQFSQEFQGAYASGPLSVVGGLYWMQEGITSHQEAYANDFLGVFLGFATFTRTIDDDLNTRSAAAYINASYDITDTVQITGGLRYTSERKVYSRTTSTFSSNPAFTATPAFAFRDLSETWTDTSPMVNIRWKAAENVMLYARASKGFKSGGFNGRANNPGEQAAYNPEQATSYEVGLKSTWVDGRYLANLTLFTNDYEDFQARVSGTVIDPGTGLPSPELTVINAGKMKTQGVELELAARPIPGLLLDAQIGYLDAAYKNFADARFTGFGGSRAFQTPAFTPEWTGRIGSQYEVLFGDNGSLTIGAQAKYRAEMALAVDNTATNSATHLPGMWDDSVWLFDARVVWESADKRYTAGVYGQNLTDELYKTDAQEFSSVGGIRTAYYGAPKTWTLRLTARY